MNKYILHLIILINMISLQGMIPNNNPSPLLHCLENINLFECIIPFLHQLNGSNYINTMRDCFSLSCVKKTLSQMIVSTCMQSPYMQPIWGHPLAGILLLRNESNTDESKIKLFCIAQNILKEKKYDLNIVIKPRGCGQDLLLNQAVRMQDKEISILLLQHGADPNKNILMKDIKTEVSWFVNAFNSYNLNRQSHTYLSINGWFEQVWTEFNNKKK